MIQQLHLGVLKTLLPFFTLPVLGISAGGGASNTDTSFERSGTSTSSQSRVVPSGLLSLLNSLGSASQVPTSANDNQMATLNRVMTTPNTSIPQQAPIDSAIAQNPTGYEGFAALSEMAGIDPYSDQYEQDTQQAYERRAGEALSQLQSGPAAVRGGTERVPLAQGQMATSLAEGRGAEVRGAQTQQAGVTANAAQLAQQLEQQRRDTQLKAQQQLFSEMFGITGQQLAAAGGVDSARGSSSNALGQQANWVTGSSGTTTDALRGKGNQGSSHFGGEIGTNCCFIFLQGLNGVLPWYIDLARRDYYTPTRQRGYKWMARWLVPKMRRSERWALAVNAVIIRPFLRYGAWLYKANKKPGWLWAAYCHAWLATWGLIGKVVAK